MKKIRWEIERCLIGQTPADGALISRFVFPQEFIGFQGHFPAKKILSGACQIQCILSTIAKGREKDVALREVVLAKYFTPVFPDEEITCLVREVAVDGNEPTFKAIVMKGDAKVAELKLRVSLTDGQ